MEPLSIWGFTLIAMGFGAAYAFIAKKNNGAVVAQPKAEVTPKPDNVVDIDKERAIDDLIAKNDSAITGKGR